MSFKPRTLSEFFVHHVDGQVGCALGADRHWVDDTNPGCGSVGYDAGTGGLTITKNDVTTAGVEVVGGRAALNPAVVLHGDFDIRVRYANLIQPMPGVNNVTRVGIRVYDPAGLPNNDMRIAMGVDEYVAGVGLWRHHTYAGPYAWLYIKNLPVGYENAGFLRIVKNHTAGTCVSYILGPSGWVEGGNLNAVTSTAWRVQLFASAYRWSTTPVPACSMDFFDFGAYSV